MMIKRTKVQSALLLNVIVRERATIFELFASKDQTLLVRGNAFLILDLPDNRFHYRSVGVERKCVENEPWWDVGTTRHPQR